MIGSTLSDLSIAQDVNFSEPLIQKRTRYRSLMFVIVSGSDYISPKILKLKRMSEIYGVFAVHFSFISLKIEIWVRVKV